MRQGQRVGRRNQEARVQSFVSRNNAQIVATFDNQLEDAVQAAQQHGALLLVACSLHWRRSHRTLRVLRDAGIQFVCLDDHQINDRTVHVLHAEAERKARAHGDLTKERMAQSPQPRHTKPKRSVSLKGAQASVAARRRRVQDTYRPLLPIIHELLETNSYQHVADHLNDCGYRTTGGGKFTRKTVHRIVNEYDLA